ncbi:hypothetical protein BLNAU_2470 [Blattamonas nauphoetae]|uniref:Uncharacterized protein n=1 Tax=Blattamonas nauphoetae TaxID=2049346 RepID=A0ABQ9YFU1_9EUKA|nr:hypothetical protein BLNAU_2470 [Blattamonas nauphoetae]
MFVDEKKSGNNESSSKLNASARILPSTFGNTSQHHCLPSRRRHSSQCRFSSPLSDQHCRLQCCLHSPNHTHHFNTSLTTHILPSTSKNFPSLPSQTPLPHGLLSSISGGGKQLSHLSPISSSSRK